jgi:amino acid transporter
MGTLRRSESLPGDYRPDEGTPAKGGLVRALTGFGNWAMTYSGIGVSAGLFELFGFSFGFSGPAMIWGWPLVAVGTLTVVLMWAELSSHYPYAGVMYKWPTILGGRTAGWFTGWLYLFANIALATSSFAVVWLGFVPLLGLTYTVKLGVLMALLTLLVCAALNLIGIKLLGPLTERAVLLELTVVGLVLILLLIFGHHNSPAIYVSSAGTGATFGKWLPGFLGGGVISAIPFIASQSFAVIVTGATAFFYAIYFGVMVVTLRARLRGWPREPAPFSLGKWGIPVNIIAVVWTAVMAVNLFWFRAATNPVFGGLHVAFWMVGAPLAVGLAYWALVQRRRLHEAARVPAETDATEASATGAEG